jgi:D-cysteine desulfhydrase/L-cysteate sulfo-lyase
MSTGTGLATQPRVHLATLPTPLQEAPRLRAALGGERRCPRILLKRDDLTGLAFGGNKARKLEYLVADALRQGMTTLITSGAVQSNHARMTAAAARVCGLRPVLVLTTKVAEPEMQGNLLLDRLLGAEVRLIPAGTDEWAAMQEVASELRDGGERPYVIPVGGSNAIGALGYVAAMLELAGQFVAQREAPTRLYYASGSRGTQAGIALGARLYHLPCRPHGVAVSPGGADKTARAARIANEAAALLGADVQITEDELLTDEGYIGEGYGIPTAACKEAIALLARQEGVFLDPVYSGKAMAGLLDAIRRGDIAPDETVVFLHTGGSPALFAQVPLLADAL